MSDNEFNYNSESCKLVLDTAREEYLYTERRWGHLLSKTQALAATSTLLFAIFGLIKLESSCSQFIARIAFLLILVAVFIFALLLKNKNSSKIKFSPALEDKELSKPSAVIAASLAKTYEQAIKESEKVINDQYKTYNVAVYFLLAAIFTGAISMLLEFSGRDNIMSDNKPSTTETTTKPTTEKPSSKPAESPSQSYGTESETRGYDKPRSYGTESIPLSEGDTKSVKLNDKK